MGFIFLTKWLNNKCFYTTCIWMLFSPKFVLITITTQQMSYNITDSASPWITNSLNFSQFYEHFFLFYSAWLLLTQVKEMWPTLLMPKHEKINHVFLDSCTIFVPKPSITWAIFHFTRRLKIVSDLNWENFR